MNHNQLRKTYNDVINSANPSDGNPRKSIMRRVSRGEIPAILSTDTGASRDIMGFVLKSPDNIFNSFYNPRKINADDVGRLSEKALRRFYKPATTLMRWNSLFQPAKREGFKNLRALDLDSFSYIEPVLYHSDHITLKHVEPLFFGSEAYYGDEHSDDENHHSPCARTLGEAAALKTLAGKIRTGQISAADQQRYNDILVNLYDQQNAVRRRLEAMQDSLDKALEALDTIKVDTINNPLKRARVKAMRDHFIRLQKQGVTMAAHIETARGKLQALGNGGGMPANQFADKISAIAGDLEHSLTGIRKSAEDLADMAHARLTRKVRIKDESGKYASDQNAAAEDYRRLKLGIDLQFVPDTPQTLGIIKPTDKDHNAESYFIKTVEYVMNNVFDKETKEAIPIAQRGPHYGRDMSEFLTKLYALNKAEDALYAVKLLKMAEGRKSIQMFPPGFHDMVKTYMAQYYNTSPETIENNPHAKLFLDRIRDIYSTDDHSPLLYGPRDTAQRYYNKMRKFIYGRMYPSSDSFIAVPLHAEIIQKPLIKARSGLIAYLTGGDLAPISEAGRPAKPGNILENECDLYIKRNLWWRKKTEEEEKADLDKDGNPKKRFIITRLRRGYKRAPSWAKSLTRLSQLAAMGTSAVMLTGGLAAMPLLAAVPIYALGAAGAANYTAKLMKNTWRLPFVHKPVKRAAKLAVIAVVTAAGAVLIMPALPAIGAWAAGVAMAYPVATAIATAPVWGLATLKAASVAHTLFTRKPTPKNKSITFADLREAEHIPDDPLELTNEQGDFMPSHTPAPVAVVLDLGEPVETASTGENGETPAPDVQRIVEAFMQRMEARDEAFIQRMEDIFSAHNQPPPEDDGQDGQDPHDPNAPA